jgi:hypothetical protein
LGIDGCVEIDRWLLVIDEGDTGKYRWLLGVDGSVGKYRWLWEYGSVGKYV